MKHIILTALQILLASITFAQRNNVESFLPQLFYQFPNVRDIAISTYEDEIYFSVQSYVDEVSFIAFSKKENNKWSGPELVNFSGKYFDIEPFLSLDGLRLYFSSNRPMNETETDSKDFDIWYVQRKDKNSEWSAPINIGEPINADKNEFYPSLAKNNNLYFTTDGPGSLGKDDIFFSKWENGKYSNPVSLSDSINSEGYEFNAFIAPDESYIIFSGYQRGDGFGSGDLYISHKTPDSLWTKAKNLGAGINSDKMDYCPFVNIKSNMLYFTSKRTNVNNS
ncbi:MAG: hypothetical protein OEM46_11785, partial [Ignavibacteria bacterium]|nr:hypothetical protein [Ignavibacteria bacterium]